MTSPRQLHANRQNSRKSSGPRTAAGKSIASRNAVRHGLAAKDHGQIVSAVEIEHFAKALCGGNDDPELFAQAIKIAENEMMLGAVRAQQIESIERLREPYAVAFARKDNSLELAQARALTAWLAEREIHQRLPAVIDKYKTDEKPLPPPEIGFLPFALAALLQEGPVDDRTRELAGKQIEERDEHETIVAAVDDLTRLDRYQRRAWSRQKRAIREFMWLSANL